MQRQFQTSVTAGAHTIGEAIYITAHRTLLDKLEKYIARSSGFALYIQRKILAHHIRQRNRHILQSGTSYRCGRCIYLKSVAPYQKFTCNVFDARPIISKFQHRILRMPANLE